MSLGSIKRFERNIRTVTAASQSQNIPEGGTDAAFNTKCKIVLQAVVFAA